MMVCWFHGRYRRGGQFKLGLLDVSELQEFSYARQYLLLQGFDTAQGRGLVLCIRGKIGFAHSSGSSTGINVDGLASQLEGPVKAVVLVLVALVVDVWVLVLVDDSFNGHGSVAVAIGVGIAMDALAESKPNIGHRGRVVGLDLLELARIMGPQFGVQLKIQFGVDILVPFHSIAIENHHESLSNAGQGRLTGAIEVVVTSDQDAPVVM